MTGKVDSIRLAMDGIITEEQRQKMNIILCHYNEVKKCKVNLESLIFSLSEPYARQCSLVSTVPGIKNLFSAIAIISEIGADMSVFACSKTLMLLGGANSAK